MSHKQTLESKSSINLSGGQVGRVDNVHVIKLVQVQTRLAATRL